MSPVVKMCGMLVCICGLLSIASAQMKIGYINIEEIFRNYAGTKEAQSKMDKEVAKWEQDASTRQKEIKDLKDQLDKQSLLLSAERRAEIEAKLKQKMQDYQDFLQTKFGNKGEVLSKNEELTKPIIDKIQKIIDKIAKDENYDFILDARAGGVIFAKPAYNLTERVLNILNKD
ncbi:MAG TPA: OmpH family outer membrane protein [Chitinivibrionales bacterium]|nr:OmpH family outer membrane protein [Chitinivibrionales bacterium]